MERLRVQPFGAKMRPSSISASVNMDRSDATPTAGSKVTRISRSLSSTASLFMPAMAFFRNMLDDCETSPSASPPNRLRACASRLLDKPAPSPTGRTISGGSTSSPRFHFSYVAGSRKYSGSCSVASDSQSEQTIYG